MNCAADVVLHCQDLHQSPGAIGPSYDSFAALPLHESPPLFDPNPADPALLPVNCAAGVILPSQDLHESSGAIGPWYDSLRQLVRRPCRS